MTNMKTTTEIDARSLLTRQETPIKNKMKKNEEQKYIFDKPRKLRNLEMKSSEPILNPKKKAKFSPQIKGFWSLNSQIARGNPKSRV